jgi:hypothetical protein
MTDTQNTGSTGVLGEIKEGIHELEQKVEHFIHPGAEGGAATEGKPAADSAATSVTLDASQPQPTTLAIDSSPAAIAPQESQAPVEQSTSSAPLAVQSDAEGTNAGEPSSSPTSGSPGSGEAGNAGAVVDSVESPSTAANGSATDVSLIESGPAADGDAIHTTILRKIVIILRRDYNILSGELEAWMKTAEQAL